VNNQLQIEMSSSSSSTSYSYGIPGSEVKLTLNASGNHTLMLLRGSNTNSKTSSSVPVPAGQRRFPDGWVGPADMPFCKVCYDAGLPVADYTDHFVKNQPGPGGKVVCPTLLAQKCLECGVFGHTSSYCTLKRTLERIDLEVAREAREKAKRENGGWETVGAKGHVVSYSSVKSKPRVEDMTVKKHALVAAAPVAPAVKYGGFGLLAVETSSSDSEEERAVVAPLPSSAVEPSKPLTWAQRAAAAAQKPVPVSSSSSFSSTASVMDTRFQLHALCDNIQESKRATAPKRVTRVPPPPPAQTEAMQQPVNARGAAAAIASESSKKRKQNAAMVPA
jgi:hypothetical protein